MTTCQLRVFLLICVSWIGLLIKWNSTELHATWHKNRIIYGLPWISIFCHEWGDSVMIFMSGKVTSENHFRIASRVTKKLVITVTHTLFYFLHVILCPDRVHKTTKTIIYCSFCHFCQWRSFLTWHCDVTAVQSLASHEREVLALWCHIRWLFLRAQIGAKAIFTCEWQLWI